MAKKATMVVVNSNNGGQDCRFHQNDDRFLSRLLSRERYNSSKQQPGEEASFRVLYYGGTGGGSVPFMWESRPGTPKHTFNDDALPPLTPPPSLRPGTPTGQSSRKKQRGSSGFFYSVFLKLPSRKINSSSLPSSGGGKWEEASGAKSPTPTLCFGGRSGSSWRGGRRRRSSPVKSVKKMVQSMVGHSDIE